MVPYARDNVAQTAKRLGIDWREVLYRTPRRESGRAGNRARLANGLGFRVYGIGAKLNVWFHSLAGIGLTQRGQDTERVNLFLPLVLARASLLSHCKGLMPYALARCNLARSQSIYLPRSLVVYLFTPQDVVCAVLAWGGAGIWGGAYPYQIGKHKAS